MNRINRRLFVGGAISASWSKAAADRRVLSQDARRDPLAGGAITTPSGQLPLGTVPRSEQFELKSDAGVAYTIKVGFPHVVDPRLKLEIKNRRPTAVYIVDGQSFFGLATDLTRFMQWGGDVPPCLIVGIQRPTDDPDAINVARTYDLTPTSSGYQATPPETSSKVPNSSLSADDLRKQNPPELRGGGAPKFLSFITRIVKPLIEKKYDLNPQDSVLAGHSFGGLFTVDAITRSPGSFRHYLAMSPSLWWDDKWELTRLTEALSKDFRSPGRLAVFVGSREEKIAGPIASMVGNVTALKNLLAGYPHAFDARLIQILPDEDHHTVQAIALSRGLRFLLTNNLAISSE